MRKKKWFGYGAAIIISVAVTSACAAVADKSTQTETINETTVQEITTQEETTQEETTQEETTIQTEEETVFEENDDISVIPIIIYNENRDYTADDGKTVMTASYETAYTDKTGVINPGSANNLDNMHNEAKEFYKTWDGEYSDFPQYESSTSISTSRTDSKIMSFIQTEYVFMGGAHGSTVVSGINYNAETGKKIALKDLSDDMDNFLKVCVDEIKIQTGEKKEEGVMLFDGFEDSLTGLVREDNISMTDDGIVIYAQQYEIAPYVSGIIEFTIPYNKLEGILKSEYMPESPDEKKTVYTVNRIGEPSRRGIVQSTAQDMIYSMLDWTGYQFASNTGVLDKDIMTDENILKMTGTALVSSQVTFDTKTGNIGHSTEFYDENSGTYTFPKDIVEKYLENYFGRKAGLDVLPKGDGLYRSDADNLYVSVGDWGMSSPVAVYNEWSDNYEDGEMIQTVDYYMSDNMSQKLLSLKYTFEYQYDAVYRMTIKNIEKVN